MYFPNISIDRKWAIFLRKIIVDLRLQIKLPHHPNAFSSWKPLVRSLFYICLWYGVLCPLMSTAIIDIARLWKCHRKNQFIRYYCIKTFSLKDGKYSPIAALSHSQMYKRKESDLPQKIGIGQLKSKTETHDSMMVELPEPKETLRRDKRCLFLTSYTYIKLLLVFYLKKA